MPLYKGAHELLRTYSTLTMCGYFSVSVTLISVNLMFKY